MNGQNGFIANQSQMINGNTNNYISPAYNNYSSNQFGVRNTNSYMQQMNSPQQRSIGLSSGRMIQTEEEIIPNEIPMDGNLGVFVQNDLKQIFLKTWGGDGVIRTNRYVLVDENAPAKDETSPFDLIMKRLDDIENFLTAPGVEKSEMKGDCENG